MEDRYKTRNLETALEIKIPSRFIFAFSRDTNSLKSAGLRIPNHCIYELRTNALPRPEN